MILTTINRKVWRNMTTYKEIILLVVETYRSLSSPTKDMSASCRREVNSSMSWKHSFKPSLRLITRRKWLQNVGGRSNVYFRYVNPSISIDVSITETPLKDRDIPLQWLDAVESRRRFPLYASKQAGDIWHCRLLSQTLCELQGTSQFESVMSEHLLEAWVHLAMFLVLSAAKQHPQAFSELVQFRDLA